jgi:hypothetical protein
MNALELADELDKYFGNPLGPKRYAIIKQAVDMLRLQSGEISALQSDITELMTKQDK